MEEFIDHQLPISSFAEGQEPQRFSAEWTKNLELSEVVFVPDGSCIL